MSKWFQWMILTSITRSPLLSIIILGVIWWTADRFTLGILPDPIRSLLRWERTAKLKREIATNPHDRRARFSLADIYIERRRFGAAVELLKANLEAGDDDAPTLYLMGVACLGAGHPDQGEVFLNEAEQRDPSYRMGAIELERGRWRLARGDAKGAREALERFRSKRPGTVEGRVLLAQALEKQGDQAASALVKQEAWKEYVASPRFQRRRERFWAWRAKPSRPLLYAVILLLLGLGFARWGGPLVRESLAGPSYRGKVAVP